MKRTFFLFLLVTGMLSALTDGKLSPGVVTMPAQYMGNENMDSSWSDEDKVDTSGVEIPDVCISPCPYCDYSGLCDDVSKHIGTHYSGSDSGGGVIGGGDIYWPPIDPWQPDTDNGDSSGSGGNWNGGSDKPGYDNDKNESGGNHNGGTGNDEYSYHVDRGRQAFDKMERDIRNGRYTTYIATVDKNQQVRNLEAISAGLGVQSAVDNVVQMFPQLAKNPYYFAFSQTMAHANVGVALSQSVVILMEKGTNLSFGDGIRLLSNGLYIAAVYAAYVSPAWGLGLNIAGVAFGLAANYVSWGNGIDILLQDGRILHLKPLEI